MGTMLAVQKLGGFDVGSLRIPVAAVLAPLSGVTDIGFRRVAARFGAGFVVSEMVAADGLVRGEAEARLRAEGEGLEPHIVQLAGCQASWLAEAGRLAAGSGAHVIDINMGCPAKRVTGGYAGSALMRDLDHAARLIEAVVAAVAVPVTVKMRLGWDEGSRNAPDLARRAAAIGVSAITVHGRTRQQFYKGQADWAAIWPVVEACAVPVLANGDIDTAEAATSALRQSGAVAVMIGRAALGRPWLVGRIGRALSGHTAQEPSPDEKREAALQHYGSLLSSMGREVGLRHARKHLAAYADAAADEGAGLDPTARERLVTSTDPAEVERLLRRLWTSGARMAA
jgi:tRNA-dihydrouridine synthase B